MFIIGVRMVGMRLLSPAGKCHNYTILLPKIIVGLLKQIKCLMFLWENDQNKEQFTFHSFVVIGGWLS